MSFSGGVGREGAVGGAVLALSAAAGRSESIWRRTSRKSSANSLIDW
jgi:hypothetical protein